MSEYLKRAWDAFERGRRFVTHDVWHIGLPGEEVPNGFIIKQVRVAILLVRSLMEDMLLLRASALTFTTILSLVPFLAVTFFVIQTFNLDAALFDLARTRVEDAAKQVLSQEDGTETAKEGSGKDESQQSDARGDEAPEDAPAHVPAEAAPEKPGGDRSEEGTAPPPPPDDDDTGRHQSPYGDTHCKRSSFGQCAYRIGA